MQSTLYNNLGHGVTSSTDSLALSVHGLFEVQVQRTPNVTALVHQGEKITYEELNHSANQLAYYLRHTGVKQNTPVGLCLDRSPQMVIGLLAILKAGGCYVPLDPTYPPERLRLIAEIADLHLVLTSQTLRETVLTAHQIVQETVLICLEEQWPVIRQESTEDLTVVVEPSDLLYLLFTSGSTGTPKGVAMPHHALINLMEWQQQQLPTEIGQHTLQFTPLSFDVASQEIFATLCFGGTLVLISNTTRRNAQALWNFLHEQSIERLFLPFVALQQLAEIAHGTRPALLNTVVTAGEQLQITPALSRFFRQPGCTLHNHYGPTESHVVTAYTLPENVDEWMELPPIGTPINNVQIHILDAQMQRVPNGEAGDLYIGGICLAHGYYGQPDLTADRFVQNPFGPGRLYKTGDLARVLPDGNIAYRGRTDHQVKIRGFRVELGEIEVVLMHHPQVQTAVIIVREDVAGVRRLVAYLVPARQISGQSSFSTQLRDYLGEKLPDYMVPTHFVLLDTLPLTPSGKIDRRGLPAPQTTRPHVKTPLRLPKTAVERQLAELWQQALHIDVVGVDDNFFELGGTSLLLTQLHTQLTTDFPQIAVVDLLAYPTVAGLAEQIQQRTNGKVATHAVVPPSKRVDRQAAAADRRAQRRSHRVRQS